MITLLRQKVDESLGSFNKLKDNETQVLSELILIKVQNNQFVVLIYFQADVVNLKNQLQNAEDENTEMKWNLSQTESERNQIERQLERANKQSDINKEEHTQSLRQVIFFESAYNASNSETARCEQIIMELNSQLKNAQLSIEELIDERLVLGNKLITASTAIQMEEVRLRVYLPTY